MPLRIRKWFKTKLVKIMLGSESESIIDWSIVAPSNFPKLILVIFSGFFYFRHSTYFWLWLFISIFINCPEQRHQQRCESHREPLLENSLYSKNKQISSEKIWCGHFQRNNVSPSFVFFSFLVVIHNQHPKIIRFTIFITDSWR